MKISTGDTITLKPEWMDKGDESIHFVAREDLEEGMETIYISDKNCTMSIIPRHMIRLTMIEAINGVSA